MNKVEYSKVVIISSFGMQLFSSCTRHLFAKLSAVVKMPLQKLWNASPYKLTRSTDHVGNTGFFIVDQRLHNINYVV